MDGRHLMSWAQVLLRPEVGRPFEACNLMEQAALLAVTGPVVNITKAKAAGNACLKASLPTPESGLLLPAGLSAQGAASVVDEITARFARLKECVKARMKVLHGSWHSSPFRLLDRNNNSLVRHILLVLTSLPPCDSP